MKYKPILIVAGEPNSVFLEIFFKALKYKKYKSPIILIASKKLLLLQMKKLNFKININFLNPAILNSYHLTNKSINLINVDYNIKNAFKKISKKSYSYIAESFKIAFKIIKSNFTHKFINGPISKNSFLDKKFPGITEYVSKSFSIKKNAMLIYNQELSVCPVTTHLPIKFVTKNINKKIISDKVNLIDSFYKNIIGIKPNIAILGLNPHCESTNSFNEDEKILKPTIRNLLKHGYKISGPFSADTIFLKNNRKKFDVIIGMYHDQVLTPFKTLYEYNAINITLGLPFIRISPDHGPNQTMLGKNLSNPLSLITAINFLDKN